MSAVGVSLPEADTFNSINGVTALRPKDLHFLSFTFVSHMSVVFISSSDWQNLPSSIKRWKKSEECLLSAPLTYLFLASDTTLQQDNYHGLVWSSRTNPVSDGSLLLSAIPLQRFPQLFGVRNPQDRNLKAPEIQEDVSSPAEQDFVGSWCLHSVCFLWT